MRPNRLALVLLMGYEAGDKGSILPLCQPLLGKSILGLTLESAESLKPVKIIAVGAEEDEPGQPLPRGAQWQGVGEKADALSVLEPALKWLAGTPAGDVLVVDARLALLSPRSLRAILRVHRREKNSLTIAEGTSGARLFAVKSRDLVEAGARLRRAKRPRSGAADIVRLMAGLGKKIGRTGIESAEEALAVNTPEDMSQAVGILRRRKVGRLESRGVIVLDPATTWVDLDARIGRGTVLHPSVVIESKTRIGENCQIYPFVHLLDVQIRDRVKVLSSTMLEQSRVGDDAQVGPFSHFRPNTVVRPKAKVGNFVEMKNTVFGRGSKAGHLSYLGDALVGDDVNIGAGTITCNFDGVKKFRTVIEGGAFIGSGTELIAPVKVGRGAYVGAGSVITKDVSPEALAVARGRQVEKPGWARRKKTK